MYKVSESCQVQNLDLIYSKYFGYPSKGTFVEVGAFDGESFSNTSCLSDEGWRGIYIEPIKEYYDQCVARHKNNNVSVLHCSIGVDEREVDIYVSGGLTTTKWDLVEMYSEIEWAKDNVFFRDKCSQVRLDKILNEHSINPNFEVLVIDVEGSEEDVLNSFDLNYWRPKMLIIELVDKHESFQKYESHILNNKNIRNKILDLNYTVAYEDQINTIFISDELIGI